MKLKSGMADELLAGSGITRKELANELEIGLSELNRILDGKLEAGEGTARLLIAAFGAEEILHVLDCSDIFYEAEDNEDCDNGDGCCPRDGEMLWEDKRER